METTVIPYTTGLCIVNVEHLRQGIGARYLEVIHGEKGNLVAKQWRRKLVNGAIMVDFLPLTQKSTR